MENITYGERSLIPKLVFVFLLAIGVATIGLVAGSFVPPALMLPLIFLELVLLLVMVFARRAKKVGYSLMFAFMFISGITMYATLSYYVSTIGASEVLKAFGIALVSFIGIAIYAVKTKEDFSFLGGFLTLGLFVLIGFLLVGMFIPFSSGLNMGIAAAGILIFVGFTLYDFNRLSKYGFSEEEIPFIVISIYLNFINLFISILRFFKSDD
ncbi:Bax inhibitor-1/YccA family protein [Bacillus timonensis]|nr:Bax inhibitor-1/YccA family protein [Bacillus timonensis]